MTCTVSDTLRAPDSTVIPETLISFVAGNVSKRSGDTMVPNVSSTTTDENGDFSIELYAGDYVVLFRTKQDTFRAEILVPKGIESASLSDLIDLADMDDDDVFLVRWGVSSSGTLDSDGVLALAESALQFGTVSVDDTVTADNEFVYVAFPAAFTKPDVYELFGWSESPTETTVYVTQDGEIFEYTVWRSPYAMTADVPLRVIKSED